MADREDMPDDEADDLARIEERIEQEDREDEESRPGSQEPEIADDEDSELPRNEW